MKRECPEFIQLFTETQSVLESYVRALVPDSGQVKDVVQETNLAIWRKADDFRSGTNFRAWAVKIAFFEVLRHRRKMGRERLLFDDDIINLLAERNAERIGEAEWRTDALLECLENLSADQRALVRQRYAAGASVQQLAESQGKSEGAVSQALFRIREGLNSCIAGKLKTWEVAR